MFGVDGFDVFDDTNVAIARDAFVVGTEICFDDSAFATRFDYQEFFGHVFVLLVSLNVLKEDVCKLFYVIL